MTKQKTDKKLLREARKLAGGNDRLLIIESPTSILVCNNIEQVQRKLNPPKRKKNARR